MKKIIFGVNLILILSLAGFAQKPETGRSRSVKADNSPSLAAGTTLSAQLEQTLDVKKAKVGDQVLMKVTRSVKQNGETIVPKGANLIGRITQVQQKTKETAVSKLGVVFDRIQGQNLNAPISATIIAGTNAGTNAGASVAADDMLGSDISGTSSSSARVNGQSSTSNNSSNGGGLLGGVTGTAGNVVNTTTNTVGGVANTAANTVGNVAGATARTVGGTTQTLGQTINGIQISSSVGASANGSTTLSAADKNLRVEKGAAFQLRLNGMGGN
jgi:hypothetical protein